MNKTGHPLIIFCPFQSHSQFFLTKSCIAPYFPESKNQRLFNGLPYKVLNILYRFVPFLLHYSCHMLILYNSRPPHSISATLASLLFLNALSMTLTQIPCNCCSMWNTLLPGTHRACTLACARSLFTNRFIRGLP